MVCHKPVRREPWLSPKDAPCPHCGSKIQFENSLHLTPERMESKDHWQPFHSWVAEFTTLCQSDVSSEKLFADLIQNLVRTIYAVAGIIWIVNGRNVSPQYGVGLQFTGLYENPKDHRRHRQLVEQSLAGALPSIIQPPTNLGRNEENPTGWALLLVPLKDGETTKAILEIFYWPTHVTSLHQCQQWMVKQVVKLLCQSPAFQSL